MIAERKNEKVVQAGKEKKRVMQLEVLKEIFIGTALWTKLANWSQQLLVLFVSSCDALNSRQFLLGCNVHVF